jgi:hypothetical protein
VKFLCNGLAKIPAMLTKTSERFSGFLEKEQPQQANADL